MSSSSSHSAGHPVISGAVVGSFSFAMALVLEILGVFDSVREGLWHAYEMRGFSLGSGPEQGFGGLWVTAVLVYGMAWLICEVPQIHRRVVVLLSSLVLIALASPVLALWGVFWSPVGSLVATAWAGFCAILWSAQHPMPCEGGASADAAGRKIISLEDSKKESAQRKQS